MASYPPSSAPAIATGSTPVGIFVPGTKVTVGSHRVVVDRYLSEGGFAHVYVVRVPTASGGSELAVLKRVAVPDKDALSNMRTEVETMKKLKGHKKIVTYFDSHASQLKGGGYEVFLLMEFCDGGGLIDFMNTRLKNRLTEPEILKIFSDTAEGVACMHYLRPPLLHRDLKVENILISSKYSSPTYKLCDFGSTAPPRPAATSVAEGRLIEDDVQRHTTMQYRSPEMIDVYRKRPIDEKSDIWALGVLLYKLCYYTTPFEEQGQMAILTASFKFPGYPRFSDRIKALIASMLSEDPQKRPTIYQVIKEVCAMRAEEVPIKDIYATRTHSEARSDKQLHGAESNIKSPPVVGISKAPRGEFKQIVPDIAPMRRGRPSSTQTSNSTKPMGMGDKKDRDPFAALDSPSFATRSAAVDELASRFPPAEQFSLLQERKTNFEFDKPLTGDGKLKTRITNALADEAFAVSIPPKPATVSTSVGGSNVTYSTSPHTTEPLLPEIGRSLPTQELKKSILDHPKMVSIGTMTGDSPPSTVKTSNPIQPSVSSRPIWRVPTPKSDSPQLLESLPRRLSSQLIDSDFSQSSIAPRRSVETLRPPMLDISRSLHRSRSAEEQSLSPTKSDKFAKAAADIVPRENEKRRSMLMKDDSPSPGDVEEISSSLDYLRQLEKEDASKSHMRKSSSSLHRLKHANLGSSAPVTRKSLAGKINSARKMFEGGLAANPRDQSPSDVDRQLDLASNNDPNIAVPDESAIDVETEELSPEMRRELERRRLSLEEKRVADAAAAYRSSLSNGSKTGAPRMRASEIQNRVKSLLDESGRTSPVKKTASGYGKYTDSDRPTTEAEHRSREQIPQRIDLKQRSIDPAKAPLRGSSSAAPPTKPPRQVGRPSAPPKPVSLRTGGGIPSKASRIDGAGEGDLEGEFSKRYPDLSFDMVETEIGPTQTANTALRVKDV